MRDRVLDLLRTFPEGLTSDECETLLEAQHQSVSPRIYDLAKAGRIVDSGVKRATRNGVAATVWTIAAFAGLGGE